MITSISSSRWKMQRIALGVNKKQEKKLTLTYGVNKVRNHLSTSNQHEVRYLGQMAPAQKALE